MRGKIVIELLPKNCISVDAEVLVREEDKIKILMSLAQSLSDRKPDKTLELLEKTSLVAILNQTRPVSKIQVEDKETGVRVDSDLWDMLEELADGKKHS